jgi:hypothetical protein
MTTKPGQTPDLRKPNHQTPRKPPKTSLPASAASGNGMITKPGRTSGLHQPSPADGPLTAHSLATRSAPFGNVMTTDARTKLGPPATAADGPSSGALPPQSPSGHGGNLPPRRPDTPRAFAIFTGRRSSGVLPTSGTSRPQRQPATPTSRHTSGRCHFHRQTDFGRTAPNLSTADGPQITAATAAISAASGKSGVPSPTRRTSPVMTNKRVRTGAECRRNGFAIRRPISCGLPRRPASILAAAS